MSTLLSLVVAHAQVNSFPYSYDFESFTTIQNTGSCVSTGMSVDNWTQSASDDGDWLADNDGTPSIGTGPGATDSTSGVGDGTDFYPGTSSGIYLYIEGSTAGCTNSEYSLLSPEFDFSAVDTFYRFLLAVNMNGDGVGSLHIDVRDSNVWHNDVWVHDGDWGEDWHDITVNLAAYNTSEVQIRIRGRIKGTGVSDIAIDYARVEQFTPPRYDALFSAVDYISDEFTIIPLSQRDSISFKAKMKNEGLLGISGVNVEVSEGSYSEDINIGNIASYDTASGTTNKSFWPSLGVKNMQFVVSTNESDSFSFNDTAYVSFEVSDSVLAMDDGVANMRIGYNGATGFQGQVVEVRYMDTLTSVSFNVNRTNTGDSVRIYVYEYNAGPGTLLSTTKAVMIDSITNWYTARLNCEQVLSPGLYFIVLEQMDINHIGFAGSFRSFKPNTAFYSATGATWTSLETAGFEVGYHVRLNFGKTIYPNVQISTSSNAICQGVQTSIQASGAKTYQWSPSNVFANQNAAVGFATFDTSMNISVVGTNACGFSSSATKYITVEKGPTATVTADTTVCKGDMLTLQVNTNNSYRWVSGPTNADFTVTVNSDTLFYAIVDSTNGCRRTFDIEVGSSEIAMQVSADTTLCTGNPLTISASGANSYQWLNGPNTADYSFVVDNSATYKVVGTNAVGCSIEDSVVVTGLQSPQLVVSADTGACFRDSLYLSATGADSIKWKDGPASTVYPIRVLKAAKYFVEAYNANGCTAFDTVNVAVFSPPFAVASNDTTVCEGEDFTLNASGGDIYTWSTGQTGASITTSLTETTTITVNVASFDGCSDDEDIKVTVNPLPEVGFTAFVDVDSVQLTNTSVDANRYHWDFGDGDTSNEFDPYHLYDTSGNYTITLSAINGCGSVDSSITITIDIPIGYVADADSWTELSLYPSPATTELFVLMKNNLVGDLKFRIIDAQSKIVLEHNAYKSGTEFRERLDLTELSKGVYIIQIQIDGQQQNRRIVLQ